MLLLQKIKMVKSIKENPCLRILKGEKVMFLFNSAALYANSIFENVLFVFQYFMFKMLV